MIKTRLSLFMVLLSLLVFPGTAKAASSQWHDLGGGKARLLAHKDPATNMIEGVIEVKLEPGWKTYWRSPGDSGIPPEFDFSGSDYLGLTDVKFPTPQWINLEDTAFFGYRDTVSFVFSARAEDDAASINLEMLIGVCEEICIPATASLSVSADDLNSSDPRLAVDMAVAKAKLPQPAEALESQIRFSVEGDAIKAMMTEIGLGGSGHIVISTGVISTGSQWVSDPVAIAVDVSGDGTAALKLPPAISVQSPSPLEWEYTLIVQSGDDHKVQAAFDGSFVTASGQVQGQ